LFNGFHLHAFFEEKSTQGFGRRNLKESDHLQDVGLDGRVILKNILKK
jgi:hypothetical protein